MPITKDQLQRLYVEQGLTYQEVANRLGYASTTPVETAMEKYDIQSRSFGGKSKDAPWKDRERLKNLYHSKNKTIEEVAEELGCSYECVRNWMEKLEVETERRGGKPAHPRIRTEARDGYEDVRHSFDCQTFHCSVHRLSAVAWFGIDEVIGKDVHHKNEIPWDNREENLQLMTRSEHMSHHHKKGVANEH
jgi:transposase-like protein